MVRNAARLAARRAAPEGTAAAELVAGLSSLTDPEDVRCVLCQRELQGDAVARLKLRRINIPIFTKAWTN